MDFTIFFTTFGIIFLAELGDKTQLTAMALAVRFSWGKTFIGIAAAFAVLNLGAVALGKLLFDFLPLFWIQMVSAAMCPLFRRHHSTGEGIRQGKRVDARETLRGERGDYNVVSHDLSGGNGGQDPVGNRCPGCPS